MSFFDESAILSICAVSALTHPMTMLILLKSKVEGPVTDYRHGTC